MSAPTLPIEHRLSEFHERWVKANWGWDDLTADEHRCLWVLEQHLVEQGRRFYHLPRPAAAPLRFPGSGTAGGFLVPIGGFGSFDGAGLARLTVASFTALVRVELSVARTWVRLTEDYTEVLEVRWDSNPELPDEPDAENVWHQSAALALRLNARQADGSGWERHPGPDYLRTLCDTLSTPTATGG